ncbi:hypothetical protein [Acinetobacter sp.]|jgi:hypothetical protein|uniref:hypothetical protein n=1 Tax=Acinetobacter sp. TaxID=472 RepID=UPI0035AF7B6F
MFLNADALTINASSKKMKQKQQLVTALQQFSEEMKRGKKVRLGKSIYLDNAMRKMAKENMR